MKLKPCPFCGNTNLISWKTGDGYEIKCRFITDKEEPFDIGGCGGRMIVYFPDEMPRGVRTLAQLYKLAKKECEAKWHERV